MGGLGGEGVVGALGGGEGVAGAVVGEAGVGVAVGLAGAGAVVGLAVGVGWGAGAGVGGGAGVGAGAAEVPRVSNLRVRSDLLDGWVAGPSGERAASERRVAGPMPQARVGSWPVAKLDRV